MLAVYLFAMVASLLVPAFTQPAAATAAVQPDWVFVYPTGPKTLAEMNTALSAAGGNGFSDGLGQSYLLNKNTLWGSAEFRKFSFNPGYSEGTSVGRQYVFSTSYYCADGKALTKEPSSGDYSFVELQAIVGLRGGFAENAVHDTYLTIRRFTNYNSTGTGIDYAINNTSKPGTLAQVSKFSDCLPPETSLTATPKPFGVRNITDPAVNDATWKGARDKVKDQAEAEPITALDTSSGAGGSTDSSGTDEDAASQCAKSAAGVGWIVCPFIGLVNDLFTRSFQKIIINALIITPLQTDGDAANLYGIWKNMRDLANVTFLLIFMVIVIANTLSINVQAYTIKKMIPKLVAAAILVQFSYVISAIIIDVGNILGGGIADLINSVANIPGDNGSSGVGGAFQNILSTASSAVALVLGLGGGALALLKFHDIAIGLIIAVALLAFFAFMSIVLTLMFRKLIIIMLIILSPLAFAALVLPSTEKMFKAWMGMFIQVIMMFPIIVFLFSAATVLQQALGNGGVGHDLKPEVGIPELMAAIMPLVVCFMVPMTFKWGGKLMSFGGGQIDGLVRGKIGGGAIGKFKGSALYTVPKDIRKDDKADMREVRSRRYQKNQYRRGLSLGALRDRGRQARERLAVAQTRGDFTGSNTRMSVGEPSQTSAAHAGRRSRSGLDPRRYMGREEHMDKVRKENILRRDRYNTIAGKLAQGLDETRLEELMEPVLRAHRTGDWDGIGFAEIDQAELAAGAYLKKTGRSPHAALAALTHASEVVGQDANGNDVHRVAGYDFARAGQGKDSIIDQNLHKLEQVNPIEATTARRGVGHNFDYLGTQDARDVAGNVLGLNGQIVEDAAGNHLALDGSIIQDAAGNVLQPNVPLQTRRAAKIIGHDQYGAERLRTLNVNDLGALDEAGMEELATSVIRRPNPVTNVMEDVRGIDYMLERDPSMIYTLRRNTAYGRMSPAVKQRVVEHGRAMLPGAAAQLAAAQAAGGGVPTGAQQAEITRLQRLHDAYLESTVFDTAGRPQADPGIRGFG